jgi:hypothetical protein
MVENKINWAWALASDQDTILLPLSSERRIMLSYYSLAANTNLLT